MSLVWHWHSSKGRRYMLRVPVLVHTGKTLQSQDRFDTEYSFRLYCYIPSWSNTTQQSSQVVQYTSNVYIMSRRVL